MTLNSDSGSAKHGGSRANTPRRNVQRRRKESLADAEQPHRKLVSAEIRPHSRPNELPAREERVRVAAYLLAEQRGFAPGHELEDWLAAEAAVDRLTAVEISGVIG